MFITIFKFLVVGKSNELAAIWCDEPLKILTTQDIVIDIVDCFVNVFYVYFLINFFLTDLEKRVSGNQSAEEEAA